MKWQTAAANIEAHIFFEGLLLAILEPGAKPAAPLLQNATAPWPEFWRGDEIPCRLSGAFMALPPPHQVSRR